ncbi:MAG: hypothetical protein FWF80_02925 [Defluviitaleaceae bacterium]|nr:hypothetical protein [Defluviitaleaceae bacterium]
MKKNILKIMVAVGISVLSVGVFSAAYLGFNRITLDAATNTTAVPIQTATAAPNNILPLDTAPPYTSSGPDASPPEVPALTVIDVTDESFHTIAPAAMSPDEAAQIGASYIWQVFGTNIDGAEVEMWFADHAGMMHTWWAGRVVVDDLLYNFTINAITGERIDIMRSNNWRTVQREELPAEQTDWWEVARVIEETGWFEKSIDEQIAFADAADQAREFKEIATTFAQRHFNTTALADVRIDQMSVDRISGVFTAGNVAISGFTIIATDEAGREANITISADPNSPFTAIHTQQNDFIPGWEFTDDGTGIG